MRLKRTRKLSRPAPAPPPGKRGAPRKDGDLFQGSRPQTWGEPGASWKGSDWRGKPLVVQAWKRLHFRQAREVEVTVFRVLREGASGTKRDPRERWFVWGGEQALALSEVAESYRRRFSHEHSYRFLKQDLLWTKAHVRTPEQFERWSLVVATAMNHLVLARLLGQAAYRRLRTASRPGNASAGEAGNGRDFATAWHTSTCAQTTRKIAGAARWGHRDESRTLRRGAQAQTGA